MKFDNIYVKKLCEMIGIEYNDDYDKSIDILAEAGENNEYIVCWISSEGFIESDNSYCNGNILDLVLRSISFKKLAKSINCKKDRKYKFVENDGKLRNAINRGTTIDQFLNKINNMFDINDDIPQEQIKLIVDNMKNSNFNYINRELDIKKKARQEILDKNLPLKIQTRIKSVVCNTCKRGDQHEEVNYGVIIDKDCLVGDFMYLVKYDKEFPGWCFGKTGKNIFTDIRSEKDNLSWEYRNSIVEAEEL